MNTIRNFSIIAHIDHGKSTLADRMLEVMHTIEKRKMQEQVLDSMELERERGITIKMQPVRMKFMHEGREHILNLIDTPGHIDFSYEVSRALHAVEGAILLVDATQGVQAQTLTTLSMAKDQGLVIIPAVSKIDSPLARTADVKGEISRVLNVPESDILECSGKTGEGVENLLHEVVKRIPAPTPLLPSAVLPSGRGEGLPSSQEGGAQRAGDVRALIFDFQYSNHRGIIVYVRITDGSVKKGDQLMFSEAKATFIALEVGTFSPQETPADSLTAGEIGYIVTGIKQPGVASVGDTVTSSKHPLEALPGYMSPKPVVWASIYPESQDDLGHLRLALGKLKLTDSSLTFEEESSGTLGRGFRCGFLGMLHLEIITERLKREFSLELIVTTPSITYEVEMTNGKTTMVYSPTFFPEDNQIKDVREPWVNARIITPSEYLGAIMQMLYGHEAEVANTETFSDNRTAVTILMPLREMMRGFFDELKSVSAGYASVSYEITDMRDADVTRLDVLVADEVVPAFSRVVSRRRVEEEAEKAVARLHAVLPRQMFTIKIQGRALGRIIASETISGMRKDVTQHMYGGDITRKMKLREKQKEGKKKMKERGEVNIPQEVFVKMMRLEK